MEPPKPTSASDSDSEDEDAAIELLNLAETTPRNYDAHIAAVQALRSCGDLVQLRKARNLFSHEFPLTTDMWSEWIQDEITAQGNTKRAKLAIAELYNRAVSDYYSPVLWTARLDHEIDLQSQGIVKIERVRKVYEEGLAMIGCDVQHASKFWSTCRTFEAKLMEEVEVDTSTAKSAKSIKNSTSTNNLTINRALALHKRQIAVPMNGSEEVMQELEKTMETFNTNTSTTIIRQLRRQHAQALSRRHAREQWEEMTTKAKPEDKEHRWLQYLDFENRSTSHGTILIALYERALVECCLSPRVWMNYCNVMSTMQPIHHERLASVRYRAIRNITYLGELWSAYMRSCERSLTGGYHKKEWKSTGLPTTLQLINNVLERALSNRFASDTDYSCVWLSYLHATMRATPTLKVGTVRTEIVRAKAFMTEMFGSKTVSILPILLFEVGIVNNSYQESKILYEQIIEMKSSLWSSWTMYIQHAKRNGDMNEVSALYQRAATHVTDHCNLLMNEWMHYCGLHNNKTESNKTESNTDIEKNATSIEFKQLEQEEACFIARANRTNEIAAADAKARARWKLDATIAAQKETKRQKAAEKQSSIQKKSEQDVSKKRSRDVSSNNILSEEPPRKIAKDTSNSTGNSIGSGRHGGGGGSSSGNTTSSSSSSSTATTSSTSSTSSSSSSSSNSTKQIKQDVVPPSCFLYFVGVPKQKTSKELQNVFDKHGKSKDLIFALNKSGETFGRGVLEYATVEMAQAALTSIQTNPIAMGDRLVHLTFSKVDGTGVQKRNGQVQKKITKTKNAERKARISFVPRGVKKK